MRNQNVTFTLVVSTNGSPLHYQWQFNVTNLNGVQANQLSNQRICLTAFNRQIINGHKQRYDMSCIPSSLEMVLKLLGREPESYYDLQDAWKNKSDGTFGDFEIKTIKGVTFHRQFGMPRGGQFPLSDLFATIDRELKAGRYVIVSLTSNPGWHMYVIYYEDGDGDVLAVSKIRKETIAADHVKKIIKGMNGTDIMTYELGAESD